MIANQGYNAATATHLPVERAWIYRPQTAWLYSHHPSLTFFNERYYAIWSNGRRDEDAPGQRVLIASSADFLNWSEPEPLLGPLPGQHGERVLTAAGFHQYDGQLVAYAGAYEYRPECLDENGQRRPGDKGHMNTTLLAVTSRDGRNWTAPIDLGLPIVPNHGPQRTASGRLIVSGNISFPYTDDPSGLRDWRMTGIYPESMADTIVDDSEGFWQVQAAAGWPNGLCEGSFYLTDDGVLHMLLRTNTERLWLTQSNDDGATWSPPEPAEFSDNATKFHFGRLPDGRFYYVGCPDPEPRWQRSPLVLSLSEDGRHFDHHYILADESTPYKQCASGMHKGGDYGYPHTLVRDGYLHVIVSRRKEAVEVLRVPVPTALMGKDDRSSVLLAPLPKSTDIRVLDGVAFHVIKHYEYASDGYRFLHGVALAWHQGRLYASFGHNRGAENTCSEEARGRLSTDGGRTWGEIFTIGVGASGQHAVSHGVFLSHRNRLWAFHGAYHGTMENVHTRAYLLDDKTGTWEYQGVVVESGFWPMQEPLKMVDGNWIMSGISVHGDCAAGGRHPAAVAISHGEDLTSWDLVVIPSRAKGRIWGESTVYLDGHRVVNIARYGEKPLALVAVSDDCGRTWAPSTPGNLPMTTSKPYAGTLSTGEHYLIGTTTADCEDRRSPLTIALTRPGETGFSRVFVIRHALFPAGPGESHAGAALSYPYAIEHAGKLYVGYSNNGGGAGRVGEGRELWNNNSAELAVIPIKPCLTNGE